MLPSIFLLSLLPLGLSHPSPPSSRGTWVSLPNITVAPRQEHSTFFLPPSTIGILGGIIPGPNGTWPTTDIHQHFNLKTQTWSTVAPIPIPLNHPNVAVANGKIYLLGGLAVMEDGSWDAIPDSWVWDPSSRVWASLPPIPAGEARGSATMGVFGDKIVLAGGMKTLEAWIGGLQDSVTVVSIFDTKKKVWLPVPVAAKNIPEARDHAGGAVVGDKFYVLGGRDHGQHNVKDTVFVLGLRDLEKGWRTSAGRLPTPRGGLCAGVVGDKVYTFGGEGNTEVASGVFNETEVFDARRERWERLGQMSVPRHGTSAVGVGGKVYIPGGGVAIGPGPVATFDVFVP